MPDECAVCEKEFKAKELDYGCFESMCPECADNYDGPSDEDLSHFYEHGTY